MKLLRAVPATVRAALIVIGISPFLPRLLGDVPLLGVIGRLFGAWFAFQCHRDAARTLALLGEPMSVCVRCLGIYLGLGLGALVLHPRLSVWPLRLWVGSAALAMVLDVVTEGLELRPDLWIVRLLTGLALAYPVGSAIVWALRDLSPQKAATSRGP